jgi:hypothetical protein
MKSAAGLVFFVLQVGCAGIACAAGPADDAKAVAQCVDKAQKDDRFPGACIGVVADPCIKAAGDADGARACAKRELAVWRERLKKAIAAIGKNGPKQMAAAVAAAQKSLAAAQDSLCPQFNGLDPGMSMGGEDYCRLQETARRVLVLERLAAAVSEH